MHKHMNAIQRACIFLLTLLLFLVPLSALGEPKAEPAPEAAAAETGITAFVSPHSDGRCAARRRKSERPD